MAENNPFSMKKCTYNAYVVVSNHFLFSPRTLGFHDPIWRSAYFSDGLVRFNHHLDLDVKWWIFIVTSWLIACGPLPVTVTARIITISVGDPYEPSFTTVTGRGPHPTDECFHYNVESNRRRTIRKLLAISASSQCAPRCFVGPAAHFAKVGGARSCEFGVAK